jgi:hypothetical protein
MSTECCHLNRNVSLDILKFSMALFVVGLHAGFLNDITTLGSYLTVNGIFRIVIPIFLLINGFYFYPVILKRMSRDWLKRLLYLYVFWMLFYSYFWIRPSGSTTFISLAKISITIVFGYYHLWYFPGVIGAAIIMILLKNQRSKVIILAVLTSYLIGLIIQYIGNYHILENQFADRLVNYFWFYRNFLFFAFPFFAIGFYINKYGVHKKISFRWLMLSVIVGFLALMSESYLNYISPFREGGFSMYLSLLIVCPALFLLFLNLNIAGRSKKIALYSTGIYVIHPLFLIIFNKMTHLKETPITFVVIALSIIASFILIKVNERLRFIL